jgi:hypothetical protein
MVPRVVARIEPLIQIVLSPQTLQEIAQVEAAIDRIEAQTIERRKFSDRQVVAIRNARVAYQYAVPGYRVPGPSATSRSLFQQVVKVIMSRLGERECFSKLLLRRCSLWASPYGC